MPSALPEGEPAPADGSLPEAALVGLGARPFGVYVHVPFCTVRCGYCDFNTYTADELGDAPGASRATYADAAIAEVRLARRVLGGRDVPVSTVFLGGGTPTLLPPADLARILAAIDAEFGLAADAEVTTESNPDSVDADDLARLREAGFTRVSFGMQSAVPHVLATLDRTHDPARVPSVVEWARAAGFEQVSLDLIYGTPGESLADWATSLDAALAARPDHVSAYSLIVEDGTALARRVRRGELPMPDEDDLADKYVLADERLHAAGLRVVRGLQLGPRPNSRCRHNVLYWTGGDWWGVGPGAHSHVGGVRWWNVKHPAAYAERLAAGVSPAHAREVLDAETRRVERVLLELRLRDGLPGDVLDACRSRRGAPARRPGASWTPVRPSRLGLLTTRAGCWPTPWCATCCPDRVRSRAVLATVTPVSVGDGDMHPYGPGGQGPYPYGGYPPQYPTQSTPAGYPYAGAPYGVHPITGEPYSDKSKVTAGLLQLLLPFIGICGVGRLYAGHAVIGIPSSSACRRLRPDAAADRLPDRAVHLALDRHRRHRDARRRASGRRRTTAPPLTRPARGDQ